MLGGLAAEGRVYLACGATDLRKSIDGLAAIVQLGFELDPFSQACFVFCNRGRDKMKILRWDLNGFWLYYRRLERGRFKWPPSGDSPRLVSHRELQWLLDGLTLEQHKAHPAIHPRTIS
jgi:transposase